MNVLIDSTADKVLLVCSENAMHASEATCFYNWMGCVIPDAAGQDRVRTISVQRLPLGIISKVKRLNNHLLLILIPRATQILFPTKDPFCLLGNILKGSTVTCILLK